MDENSQEKLVCETILRLAQGMQMDKVLHPGKVGVGGRRLSVAEEVEAALTANLHRAQRLRQSILKQAFAGRLAAQDPVDEPASALLERIRTERAKAAVREKSRKKKRR